MKIEKIRLNTLPTLDKLKDYYELHLFEDGSSEVYNSKFRRYLKAVVGKGKDNYLSYQLTRVDGKRYKAYLHRLVALAFVDGYEEGYFVDHIDNNKQNAHIDNLQWLSHKDNTRKAVADGTKIGRPRVEKEPKTYMSRLDISKSASNGRNKITYDDVTKIFYLCVEYGISQAEVARELNISRPAVSQIVNGKRWKDHPASIKWQRDLKLSEECTVSPFV